MEVVKVPTEVTLTVFLRLRDMKDLVLAVYRLKRRQK